MNYYRRLPQQGVSVLAYRPRDQSQRLSVVRSWFLQTWATVQAQTCETSSVYGLPSWFLSRRTKLQIHAVSTHSYRKKYIDINIRYYINYVLLSALSASAQLAIFFFSPRFELPAVQDMQPKEGKKIMITCHFCGEGGHKAIYCNKMPPDVREAQVRQEIDSTAHPAHHHNGPPQPRGPQKPLEEVTCYKCGQKGHYANKCPKGHLAFLSHAHTSGGGGGQNTNYRR